MSGAWRRSKPFGANTTVGKMTLSPDFKEFVALLNARDVRFLVVGGYAIAFHGHTPHPIDLITSLKGVEFDACYEAKVLVEIDGVSVPFIDLEHLKQNKRSVGRHQDRADLEQLE